MNRYQFCLFAQAACTVGAIAFGSSIAQAQAKKPNIVLIMTDDAAYSDFGFSSDLTGAPTQVLTPNIDALAQQSVIASQAYVTHSVCSPSRAGLLSGQYQQRYGYEENIASSISSPQGLNSEQITIAQRLKSLNYTTGAIGKWHQGFANGLNRPLDKGFDEFYGLLGGGRSYWLDTKVENAIHKNNQYYESQYRVEGDQSRYDPVQGRYLTDAFGEEAADFVNRHADDANPFFMYMALTGPHEPFQAKQSDLDLFVHITDPTRRSIAAMTYAVDRAVGDVMNALESNGIDDETIVVFTNDNGAVSYVLNPPFRGHKGTTWEGGIRVPFLIKAPGLQPSVYDTPLSLLDLLPTFVTAAGGDVAEFPHDGIDVMPYVKGEDTQDPDRPFFWRSQDKWAVRKGDWKLVSPYFGFTGMFLHNIAQDPDENDFSQFSQHPEIVADLSRELTHWEAQMAKLKWGYLGATVFNTFDHFVFRVNEPNSNWSTTGGWFRGGTTNIVDLQPSDAYPNAILEFGVRNDGDFTATNNMTRWSKSTFMLNEMRFSGNFAGTADHSGTVNGNKVLFVKTLAGQLPSIRLDATSSVASQFGFHLNLEIQLLHDLEITGNGTQEFLIGGGIRDYYEPQEPNVTDAHNVVKTGTSSVTLAGTNTFAGTLTVEQGNVTVEGASAGIVGAAGIYIGSEGSVALRSGTVSVPWIIQVPGGEFQFSGGLLKVVNVIGDLTKSGGVYSPGLSTAVSTVSGDFSQQSGVLEIEIGGAAVGSQYDTLIVDGTVTLGGILDVNSLNAYSPTAGQSFQVLTAAGGVDGTFAESQLPTLAGGLFWNVLYGTNSVILAVAPTAALNTIPGDFNSDGTVDAADYSVWRDRAGGTSPLADANFDGQVNNADYALWKAHFGFSLTGSGFAAVAAQAVPEPTLLAMIVCCAAAVAPFPMRRRPNLRHFRRR